MQRPERAPEELETDRPTAARIYDYFLGGNHNFAADRAMGDQLITMVPDAPLIARANRAFLRRAVTYLMSQGISQFLDIGSGIPTLGNVHEVAQGADPLARVVYVDIDPVAVEHSRALLAGNDRATAIEHDLRKPDDLLAAVDLPEVLDFDQPVGLLLAAVLHFVTDEDDPYGAVRRLGRALAPGSFLAISHGTMDSQRDLDSRRDVADAVEQYKRTDTPGQSRTRAEVERFFQGFELVEPGVVWLSEWRPDAFSQVEVDSPGRINMYAGVGRKA